MSMIYRVRKRQ